MQYLIAAIISLIILVYATWSAQSQLTHLRMLLLPQETAQAQAKIAKVELPHLRAGERGEHLRARVEISYKAGEKEFGRTLMPALKEWKLKQGDSVAIIYLKRAPEMMMLEDERDTLSRQISGMQTIMFALGIACLVVPFGIAGFGRKRQKK